MVGIRTWSLDSDLSILTDLGSEVLALVQILKAQSVVSYELGNGKLSNELGKSEL